MEKIEGFQAYVGAVKTLRGERKLDVPIDVTDLVDVDREQGVAITTRVTAAELLARQPSLGDLSLEEGGLEIGYDFRYTTPNRKHEEEDEYEEPAAYSADPDGIGRWGWRKPGMHKRRAPKDGPILTHGPGKRKKGKRK